MIVRTGEERMLVLAEMKGDEGRHFAVGAEVASESVEALGPDTCIFRPPSGGAWS
jgi:hypothetical protein